MIDKYILMLKSFYVLYTLVKMFLQNVFINKKLFCSQNLSSKFKNLLPIYFIREQEIRVMGQAMDHPNKVWSLQRNSF